MGFKAINVIVRQVGIHKLLLSSVAAVAFALSTGAIGATAAIEHAASFNPPDQPMILTRTLLRPLSSDAEVRTKRTYQIQISRSPSGYRIEGELLKADMEAPPQFEALAQIERSRPDSGLFPITLDQQGYILPAEPHKADESVLAASDLARSMIPTRLLPHEVHGAQAFIGTISANPVQTGWPEDLFRPETGKRSLAEIVSMPDGKIGQIIVEIEATADFRTGLLSQFTRHVTTDIDGSQRVTIETWVLAPAVEP